MRAVVKKGVIGDFVRDQNADVYIFQEVKMSKEAIDKLDLPSLFPGYHAHWSIGQRPGYSGLLTLTQDSSLPMTKGLHEEDTDEEGRVVTLDLGKLYLINVYFPNASRDLKRLPFKIAFNKQFEKHCADLSKTKPLIIGGDFNVAHEDIDIARPRENDGNSGFTKEERSWMSKFLSRGYIDTFREFTKDGGHYTWWAHYSNARARNVGWRIDYFIVSKKISFLVKDSVILPKVMGSDHCPISLKISL